MTSLVPPTVVFVFGHLDLTPEEFEAHYRQRLLDLNDTGCHFVVGDARGADAMAQAFLAKIKAQHVTVFHMLDTPRNNVRPFPTVGGFASDLARDEAMTAASTVDLGWVRPGREKSGTAKNFARRAKVSGKGTG